MAPDAACAESRVLPRTTRRGLGRVLAVVAEGSDARLPVFVSESAGDNLHVGQRYELQAIIEQGGLIYVEALQKY